MLSRADLQELIADVFRMLASGHNEDEAKLVSRAADLLLELDALDKPNRVKTAEEEAADRSAAVFAVYKKLLELRRED